MGLVRSPLWGLLAGAWFAMLCAGCGDDEGGAGPLPDGGAGAAGGGGGGAPPSAGAVLPCEPGQLPLDDGSCVVPGVPADQCGQGFEADGEGGCRAVMPPEPCDPGQLALPGETLCRPVAPCAAGPWGDIPTEPNTQFVDAAYGGGNSDGSQAQPWTSVQAGVDAAVPGAIVAIAAGTYGEHVTIDHGVTLWGVCPEQVLLQSSWGPTVQIDEGGSTAEVRDLAIGGVDAGVAVLGATDVLLDRLWIHDTDDFGVFLQDDGAGASATLRGSLVEGAVAAAVCAEGGSMTIEDTELRHGRPNFHGEWGRGLSVADVPSTGTSLSVTVRRSVISFNRGASIVAWGADLVVEDSLIRDTLPRQSDQRLGLGLDVFRSPTTDHPSNLVLRRSVVERSRFCGVSVVDSDLQMEHTIVRDVQPQESDSTYGIGLRLMGYDPSTGERPVGAIRASIIGESHVTGMRVIGAELGLESTIVQDIHPQAADASSFDVRLGRGLAAYVSRDTGQRSVLTMGGCVVEQVYETGVLIMGSEATIDSSVVREVESDLGSGMFGTGITFQLDVQGDEDPAAGSLERSVVENTRGAGVAVLGADVDLAHVIVQGVRPQELNDGLGDGIVLSPWIFWKPDHYPTRMSADHITVIGSARAGIANFASTATLSASLLECNFVQLDGEPLQEDPFTFDDLGDNLCRCGDEIEECAVLSSGLTPPGAF